MEQAWLRIEKINTDYIPQTFQVVQTVMQPLMFAQKNLNSNLHSK